MYRSDNGSCKYDSTSTQLLVAANLSTMGDKYAYIAGGLGNYSSVVLYFEAS